MKTKHLQNMKHLINNMLHAWHETNNEVTNDNAFITLITHVMNMMIWSTAIVGMRLMSQDIQCIARKVHVMQLQAQVKQCPWMKMMFLTDSAVEKMFCAFWSEVQLILKKISTTNKNLESFSVLICATRRLVLIGQFDMKTHCTIHWLVKNAWLKMRCACARGTVARG